MYTQLLARNDRAEYEALFGTLPDTTKLPPSAGPVADPTARAAWEGMQAHDRDAVTRLYANMGKAIAAYERTIMPGPRVCAYLSAKITA